MNGVGFEMSGRTSVPKKQKTKKKTKLPHKPNTSSKQISGWLKLNTKDENILK